MNIQSARLDPEDCVAITNYMTTELYEIPGYRVISWNDVSQMLEHQSGMQLLGCEDEVCFSEIGGALGVDYIISGDIGALGDSFIMTIRQIDIVRAETVSRVSRRVTGDIGLLIDELPAMVRELFRTETAQKTQTGDRADGSGIIYVQSIPSGASVEIDGQLMQGVTPVTLRDIPTGERRIIVRKGNYYGTEMVTLAPDAIERINVEMDHGTGTLRVFTNPSDVIVRIAGAARGSTPCVIENVSVGLQNVELVRDGYFDYEKEVEISMDKTVELDVEMRPAGFVSVTVPGHRDARIIINGTTAGLGSVRDYPVEVGECVVTVEKPDFELWKNTGTIQAGDKISMTAELVSVFGAVNIESKPQGADVYLNDNHLGKTPLLNERIVPDNYTLSLKMQHYQSVTESLSIARNATVTRNIELNKTEEFIQYLSQKKEARSRRWQWIRRITFSSVSIGAAVAGVLTDKNVESLYREYSAISDYDQQDKLDSKWSDIEENLKMRNLFYIISGVSGTGFLISIPF